MIESYSLGNFSYTNSGYNTTYSPGNNLFNSNRNLLNSKFEEKAETDSKRRREMLRLIRDLDKKPAENQNPFQANMIGKENGFLEQYGVTESEQEESSPTTEYKYKDISSKIQQAKTSVSAGAALIAAKRTVRDLKRKLSMKKGDTDELQIALSHAKRMELVARKKKHHLELEEQVKRAQTAEERKDETLDSSRNVQSLAFSQLEENLQDEEDAIFEERSEMLEDATAEFTEEMSEEMNELISEFGEEELKALEEAMEMMENMEVLDPHMSKEDLKELITKHRNSERKAIVKADMDYLKDMFKLYASGKTTPTPISTGAAPIARFNPVIGSGNISIGIDVSV